MKDVIKYLAAACLAVMMLSPLKASAYEPEEEYNSTPKYANGNYSSSSQYANPDQTIRNLQQQLREKDEQIDKYLKKLISLASNFLFVPYEKYAVNDLAIPAFEAAKGTEYYDRYYIRLKLLKNYKSDIDALTKFLQAHVGEAKKNEYDLYYWASNLKQELNALPVVQSYRQYGDGWDETYLGKIIYGLLEQLSDTSGSQAAGKIDAKISNSLKLLR